MLLKELEAGAGMLAPEQVQTLRALTAELSPIQAAWISGYLAAVANQGSAISAPATAVATVAQPSLTILYGSQTGNGKGVATKLAEQAQSQGRQVKLQSMNDYKPKQIAKEQQLVLVVSTHGEGDPPDDALGFHQFILGKRAPKLDGVQFAVLALGDSSYERFCQTGKELDQRLADLGASRIVDRVDCDVDYDDAAAKWQTALLDALPKPEQASAASAAQVVSITSAAASAYNKANPYEAELIVSQKITGRNSTKDIRHIEIDLGESGLSYQPGDALGIWLDNDPQLVEQIVSKLGLGNDDQLRQQLINELELTLLNPSLVKGWAKLANSDELNAQIADGKALRKFITNHQLIDLIERYPAKVDADQLRGLLRKLTPRLYSIASSQAEVENEVHLTVAKVADERDGEQRLGAVSGALAQRLAEGDGIKVFVEPNERFRLPQDPNTPIVMIGPGTGIAPYRAFMQQRAAEGISGNSWLVFGNPHFTEDFLYQVEWQQYLQSGELEKISLAFSRDQADKIYVQDRLIEEGEQLWQWLERGAHLYLCGDASSMAPAVEAALQQVAQSYGQLDKEQAKEWLVDLQQQKRFQKDVY